eukprot:1167852-Heterocapsa_arctica.AAC.1
MTTSNVAGSQASMASTLPYAPGSGIVVPMSSVASTVPYAPGTASSVSAASTLPYALPDQSCSASAPPHEPMLPLDQGHPQ